MEITLTSGAFSQLCVCVKMLNYDERDELDLRSPTSQFFHKGKLLGAFYLKAEMNAV